MGLLRSRQRHQQLIRHRVPLDGAARLERPWLKGPALCHLSRVADQHQFVIASLLLPAPSTAQIRLPRLSQATPSTA